MGRRDAFDDLDAEQLPLVRRHVAEDGASVAPSRLRQVLLLGTQSDWFPEPLLYASASFGKALDAHRHLDHGSRKCAALTVAADRTIAFALKNGSWVQALASGTG